jgi:hypothetical protein
MSVDVNIISQPETVEVDFHVRVALGQVPGLHTINKFGRNIEIDSGITADIWDGGHTLASGGTSLLWVAPTTARTHTIASTNAGDTEGGAGARTLRIFGLTSWDLPEESEDVTMNTASPPVTSKAYVIIYRMHVLTKGATSVNIGEITATATSDATITARIRAGEGQTQMAIFGVPSTQCALLDNFYASANRAVASGVVDLTLLVNPEPKDELTNFLTRHTFGLNTAGTSAYLHEYHTPKQIDGPAIIKVQTTSGTNNMDVSAGFDIILADK